MPARSRTPAPSTTPRALSAACGEAAESPGAGDGRAADAGREDAGRWCYALGVDERLLGCGEQLRRLAVDQALGRRAPAHLEQALWQQTATLLRQRLDWDRDHQVSPPAPAACLPCAVAADQCPTHADRRCRACGGQLHRIVVDEGFDTHPCCDRPA
ncbi:hypothetical protein [Nocardioides terrisoli]|uniref:hypothetical protein n=1 Tax=Nocardioides terrisoli TaxID=3388267 RepID=UPI00287B81C3|nr:hypothetical protein [Nocardioides marmorisolisilvae]